MDKKQKRSGGPHSTEGKGNSCLNALQHGCCSKRVIVKNEEPAEFEALQNWWFSQYDYEQARPLLEQAVLDEWLLKRAQRNYLAVDARLAETDPNEWTAEQIHRLHLMQRYKTAAERSFHRSFAAIERFRRVRVYEDLARERAQAQREERQRKWSAEDEENAPTPAEILLAKMQALPKPEPVPALEQGVKVTQEGETTVTTLSPSNQEMLAEAEQMEPKPRRVHRWLHIWPWLATEYVWADRLPGKTEVREQVMTFDEWLRATEREKNIPGGHVGPVEPDPTWVDEWKEEQRDGEKTSSDKERRTEKSSEKTRQNEGWKTGDSGAVGRGSDPEWEDGDRTYPV